jgi:signal transduction histidine kinase
MKADPDKKIKELEEKVAFLSAENESMADRAEEIFLLAIVSESISEIADQAVIIDTVLEKISILKDIPLCCYCLKKGKKLIVRISYTSYTETFSVREIEMPEDIISKLENGVTYITNDITSNGILFDALCEKKFKPNSALIIPHKSISNELSYFLFADNDQDKDRLSNIVTLIHEVINIMSDKIDNLYLLKELKKINLDLEKKISDRTSELCETNRILRREINEKRHAEEELKLKNEELNNFVYRVSHDLRAPITSVEGLINIMKLELQSKSTDMEPFINLLEDRMKNLDRFIQDILRYSVNIRIDTEVEEIDFEKIISSCFEELEYLENARIINKSVTVKGRRLYNDQVRIYEIFRNVISNAIKYADLNKEEKNLEINIKTTQKKADISIRDNGIGIDATILPKIFEMFYRGHESSKGSGIGLYIVKQAVEKIDGKIEVKSILNEGTVFNIQIPNKLRKPYRK